MDTSVAAADTTSDSQYCPSAKRIKLEGKPIGIAQPFRQQEQGTDSDQDSIDTRFDRFQNESSVHVMKSECRLDHSQPSPQTSLGLSDTFSSASTHVETTPSQVSDSTGLPGGKQWMVFISHSTSDVLWTKAELVHPLRDLKIPVTACYQYMPDSSRYDDKAIQKSMSDSCLVIIALSKAYTSSQRCVREWQFALHLRKKAQCRIVLVSVQLCSRPSPLKDFLYLDFVDPSKKNLVWDMLMEKIEECMMSLPSPLNANKGSNVSQQQQHSKPVIQEPAPRVDTSTEPATSVSCDMELQDEFEAMYNEASTESKQIEDTVSSIESTIETGEDQSANAKSYDSEAVEKENDRLLCDVLQEDYPLSSTQHLAQEESPLNNEAVLSEEEGGDHGRTKEDHVTPEEDHVKTEEDHATTEENHVTIEENHMTVEENHVINKDVEEGEVSDSDTERDQASKVTNFYNQLAMPDADRREESPIYFMRNFNNWVKSVLIRSTLERRGAVVLDLCCGKGGDLLKWKEGKISYLVCADISDVSVEACRDRYMSSKMSVVKGRPPFEAEFICEDCSLVRLRERYSNPGRRFHLTSCQFSVHYSFESFEKAHMMLRNACENILPGGHFIGTTVDSNQIIYRLREAGPNEDGVWSFGNDVFTVTLDSSLDPHTTLPLFGAKYNFKLHGVVDLPEYLVHFPTFQIMLEDFDMEFVHRQNFTEFFNERRYNKPEDVELLYRMNAFDKRTGTMSASEWEAIGLYMVYKFRKRYPPENSWAHTN